MKPKELTKEQKIIAINNAIEHIEKGDDNFMCCALSLGMIEFTDGLYMGYDTVPTYIPEFTFENVTGLARKNHLKKPKVFPTGGWWETKNKKIRVSILNLLKREIENPTMVAKLVTFTLTTRVVVPKYATDEQICNAAIPRLSEQIVNELQENLDCVVDDLECPYTNPTK